MLAARHMWKLACLTALLLCLGCNNKSPGDAAHKDSAETARGAKPSETNGDEEAKPEAIENNIYPDFMLDVFTAEEKTKLVKINKAELCPCPDANNSLHECLQVREGRCDMAQQAVSMIAGMVKGGFNETDILDQVAETIENAKRQHAFKLENRPFKGNPEAKVVVVEFADFECPHCKLASNIIKTMMEKYGDKVALYYKQFPLNAHQNAELAARASVAAHRQGKFWPMHDALFKNQKNLSFSKIVSIAQRTGLNVGKFKIDMESPDVRGVIAEDRTDGDAAGLTGTPTIFINGRRYLGETTEESLNGAIDAALREVDKKTTDTN